jgi:uncharacterized protein YbaP (TraB family)
MLPVDKHLLRLRKVFFTLFIAALACPVQASNFEHGLLWEISKPGVAASYLLGTIHSDDPRVTKLPPAVAKAFAKSRSFTGEMDMSMESMTRTQQQIMLPADKKLDSVIGETRFRKCVELMAKYHIPEVVVKKMKPWAIALQLNMPKPTSDRFLDLVLYEQAISRGLPVHGLETVAEQMAVFDNLSMPQQITLLDEALDNYENVDEMIARLIDLYLARDLAGLQTTNTEQMKKGNAALAQKVEQRLIIARNHRMAKRMQARLQEGQAFIAVGALHLPGDQGILHLLEQQGYRVKSVY